MANLPVFGRNLSATLMSSREISAVTGKLNKHVIRDIRVMIDELEKDGPNLDHEEYQELRDERGYTSEFLLNRRLVEILVTGYSVSLRAKVIDRMHELEEQAVKPVFVLPDFTNPAEAAEAWAAEYRAKSQAQAEKQRLEAQIVADQPKIEFAMAVRNMDDTVTVEEFAKTLGTGRNRFYRWLRGQGILQKSNIPYQRYLDNGWFKVIESKPWVDKEGNSHPAFSTRITGKGQVGLESRYRNEVRNGLVLLQGGAA